MLAKISDEGAKANCFLSLLNFLLAVHYTVKLIIILPNNPSQTAGCLSIKILASSVVKLPDSISERKGLPSNLATTKMNTTFEAIIEKPIIGSLSRSTNPKAKNAKPHTQANLFTAFLPI